MNQNTETEEMYPEIVESSIKSMGGGIYRVNTSIDMQSYEAASQLQQIIATMVGALPAVEEPVEDQGTEVEHEVAGENGETKRRRRRTKAEMEAARNAQESQESPPNPNSTPTQPAPAEATNEPATQLEIPVTIPAASKVHTPSMGSRDQEAAFLAEFKNSKFPDIVEHCIKRGIPRRLEKEEFADPSAYSKELLAFLLPLAPVLECCKDNATPLKDRIDRVVQVKIVMLTSNDD